jgi:predicted nucleotidyltransferase
MDNKMRETIQSRLLDIEKEQGVNIIYALESGSRAWGFESLDSDYDVRFIYAHRKNWYLNIFPRRDVIEYPVSGEFDYSGWDLRKALFLMNKSNPALFEWLKSPMVYYKDDYAYGIMEHLSKEYFSPISSMYHYIHMAKGNYREYLQTDKVKIKKYFYVLRPVLACLWVEDKLEPPPVEFEILARQISDRELAGAIGALLQRKKSGMELGLEPRIDAVNDFVETKINHFEERLRGFKPEARPGRESLEEGFIKILEHCEKPRA